MRSDSDIKRDAEAELRWSPDVDDTDIAVKVNGGEVTFEQLREELHAKCRARSPSGESRASRRLRTTFQSSRSRAAQRTRKSPGRQLRPCKWICR